MSTSAPVQTEMSEAKRQLLARWRKGASPVQVDPIRPRPQGHRTKISVDQYRIWLHNSMQADQPTYNETFSLEYTGAMDLAVLQQSLDFFIGLHEIWRTTFRMEPEGIFQEIAPTVEAKIAFVDLSGLPADERDDEDMRVSTKQAKLLFDLGNGPLYRLTLVKMSAEQFRLHLAIHHIIFDGTSGRDVFAPQIAAIYAALSRGEEPALQPGELQYADYSLWREQELASPAMAKQAAFWKNKLQGEIAPVRLPMDRPRPAVTSQHGALETFTLSTGLTSALVEIGKQCGATLNMTMLAALKVLLYRYSGQSDVIIGTGSNGRRRPELRSVMGYMVDTVPVRTAVHAEQTFAEYLGDVRRSLLEALSATELPFDQVLKASGQKRDASYHPIFQTFFSYLSPAGEPADGWKMLPKHIDTGATKFDLYVEVEEREGGVAGCVIYNSDLFDAANIRRMLGHWQTLMEGAIAAPHTPVGMLPLLTAAERQTMLVDWNANDMPLPPATMHSLVKERATATPNRIAIQFKDRELTYAELDREASRIAAHLRAAGAGPHTLVAIFLERSEYLPIGLISILKTGAGYLPLDPKTPRSRIELCLEDAAPAVVLTQESLLSVLPAGHSAIRTIEACAAPAPVDYLEPVLTTPEETAYVIHTSGSTGRPKGVELSHRAAVNLLLSMQKEPGLHIDDVLLAVTTISFDIATLEMFLPLITGAKLVVASHETTRDPFALMDLMHKSKTTVMQATPATWRALMGADWTGHAGLKVLCGGEAMTRDVAEKLLALKLELWNVYGPTETTIWSTAYRVQPGKGVVPVGRPIGNTTAYILDAQQQPVPLGVPGELYLGGAGLARGYRGQSDLTAQKFVTTEVSNGARLYRTGDYAVYRAGGIIECQGRADNQVKIRGHRIELDEVDIHLNAHPDVAAASARTWPDRAGGHRLSAYMVLKPGALMTPAVMREFLRSRLPEYMIPSDYMTLDVMPLTANGKIDRKALPEPVVQVSEIVEAEEAMTEQEATIAKIWAEVMGVERVRRSDNFFDLGGHSLLLVLLFSRINKAFGSSLPITTIFDAQTLDAFCKKVENQQELSSLVPVQTSGTRPPLFLVHSYLIYRGLSTALGNDQPMYGLRELESDGPLSIEQRADQYFRHIRKVQPHGPYHLAGWCAAGPLTVELAKRVIAAGEEIAPVILFDAWLPGYADSLKNAEGADSGLNRILRPLRSFKKRVSEVPPNMRLKMAWYVVSSRVMFTRDDLYIKHLNKVLAISKALRMPLPHFMHNTTMQTFAAFREFRPTPEPLAIHLIRAHGTRRIPGSAPDCGWAPYATKGVQVEFAPGDHESMFKGQNLEITAGMIRSAMDAKSASDLAMVS